MEDTTMSTEKSKPNAAAVQVARLILSRLNAQFPAKGAKRDKAALELAMGALIAANVLGTEDVPALEMLAFLTSVRGAAWILEVSSQDS